MGETPDEIKREIELTRERISRNLTQLEDRVRSTLDWRTRFDQRPWTYLGGAFGTAFLIGWLTAPSRRGLRERFDRAYEFAR